MKFIKELIPYIIIIIVVVLIRTFVVTPVRVDGESMYPTLKNGDILLLKKYENSYNRFDIVVVEYKKNRLVKRIIGMPGDTVKYLNNVLYINGEAIKEPFLSKNEKTSNFDLSKINMEIIPDDCYFIMGDNRNNSTDSRAIGVIHKDNILGITDFSIFPLESFGGIE